MMNRKSMTAGLLLGTALLLGAAEYTSDGFSAKISQNGMLENLKYRGTTLISYTNLHGRYNPTAGGQEKHDARFFQGWDYTGKAQLKQDGTTSVYTTESILGNKVTKDAIDYKQVTTLTPEKVTIEYTAKLKKPLYNNSGIFCVLMGLPNEMLGKGIKTVSANGVEALTVIPKNYDKTFRAKGETLAFALGKGSVFTLKTSAGASAVLVDSRAWNDKQIYLEVGPEVPWSQKPVKFDSGKEYKWTITITCKKK